jgi:hypothetical protein
VHRIEAQLLLDRRLRDRLARDDGRDAAHDLQQAGAARIDDARAPQHVQQLGRPLDRVGSATHDRGDQLADRAVGVRLCLLRHLTDDGEHRPLDRLRHRRVGSVAGTAEGSCQGGRVEALRLGHGFREPADDLGEDHAGVAPRAHQRRACHLLGEGREVGRVGGLHLLDGVPNREREVRPRVAVRDGIDVKVVEPASVSLEREQSAARELASPFYIGHAPIVVQSAAHFPRCLHNLGPTKPRLCRADATRNRRDALPKATLGTRRRSACPVSSPEMRSISGESAKRVRRPW